MLNFQPNCTFPTTTPTGFVQGPNIRATLDIVWSCGSVIILSTWSVLHLNVPPDLKSETKLEGIRKYFYLLGRKLGWMSVMLAFPEYMVATSTTNLFAAWVNHVELHKLAKDDDVPWSLTHTILANIGGIAIRFSKVNDKEGSEPPDQGPSGHRDCTSAGKLPKEPKSHAEGPKPIMSFPVTEIEKANALSRLESADKSITHNTSEAPLGREEVHGFMRDFERKQERHLRGLGRIPWEPYGPHLTLATNTRPTTQWIQQNPKKYNAEQIAPLHGNIWILDSKQLVLARTSGVINKLPSFDKEEIDDKSKIDGLMRALSVVQVFWLAVQLIARKVAGTPSSALEISTVAFSACAVIIYLTEWAKPKDIGVPFYVNADASASLATFTAIAEAAPITFLQPRRYYIAQSCIHQVIEGKLQKKHVDRMMVLMTVLSISVYGGIHLFAWDLAFPTRVERLLWRIAGLVVAIAPTTCALTVLLEDVVRHRTDVLAIVSVTIAAPAYLAARLYIIVESFRSLYYLPPGGFVANWASSAPYLG